MICVGVLAGIAALLMIGEIIAIRIDSKKLDRESKK
jgi:hypothetical protein